MKARSIKLEFHLGSWYINPLIDRNKELPGGSVKINLAIKFLFMTYSDITFYKKEE